MLCYIFLYVCVCIGLSALTCTWTIIWVHWCFKSAATPGRSETYELCGFVSVCCVCISKHVPIRVFSYPHLYRHHTAAPLTPASLFVLQFSLIFSLCGRHVQFPCGYAYAHFCNRTGAKSHMHTLSHTYKGRSARTWSFLCTYCPLPVSWLYPPSHGKAQVSSFTLLRTYLIKKASCILV